MGVQRVPKEGQLTGFFKPWRIAGADAVAAVPWTRRAVESEDVHGVVGGVFRAECEAAWGMTPMPRQSRSETSKTSLDASGAHGRCPSRRDGARRLVFHLGPAALELLARSIKDAPRAGRAARSRR
jgi:hypothetical protein